MALNIRNAEAERLATRLAKLTGENKTEAVTTALRDGWPESCGTGPVDGWLTNWTPSRCTARSDRCATAGRPMKFWATTIPACRVDGDRHFRTAGDPAGRA